MNILYVQMLEFVKGWKGFSITSFANVPLWVNFDNMTFDFSLDSGLKIVGLIITAIVGAFTVYTQRLIARKTKLEIKQKDAEIERLMRVRCGTEPDKEI